jgi:putative SOS response-associated peptidase YedK
VTNTRDDKISSPFGYKSFRERRCLVPVTSFAEPDDDKPVRWHWFALQGDEPRPLFAFAGLWREWNGPIKKDGPKVLIQTFSFMTTLPNALTKRINHERMPVLLATVDQQQSWLAGENDHTLIKPFDPHQMLEVQAGFEKKDILSDGFGHLQALDKNDFK